MEKMIDLLTHHQINLPDIFKYTVIEPIYFDETLKPTDELHYLIVVYLPNYPTYYYIIKEVI